jgi:hypothetical protein
MQEAPTVSLDISILPPFEFDFLFSLHQRTRFIQPLNHACLQTPLTDEM